MHLLQLDAAAVDKLIDNPQYASYLPVPVKKNVDLNTAVYVTEHRDEFPEVAVTRTAERQYPNDFQAADMLGYVGQINGDELKAHQGDGYTQSDIIGKTGIESMFETELRGTPGKDRVELNSQGRAVNVVEVKKPEAGHDVRLTVDLGVQHIAEESLQQGMDGARTLVDPDSGCYYAANAGAVVVLDAQTGGRSSRRRRTPASIPTTSSPATPTSTSTTRASPLINRALNAYAPGSTFKTFTSIAMLQSGLFPDGPNTVYSDEPDGCFHFGNDEKACNAGGAVLGAVDLPSALTVSSDVYFYTVGNEFWKAYRQEGQNKVGPGDDLAGDKVPDAEHPVGNAIQHTATTYGFGEQTGIGLDDQAGIIPNHEYRVKLNPNDAELQFWRRGDNASLAVGQGDVLVTPLQLARRLRRLRQRGHAVPAAAGRHGHPEQRRAPPGPARSTGEHDRQAGEAHHGAHARGPRPDRGRARRRDLRPARHRVRARSATTRASKVIGKTGTAQRTEAGHVVVRRRHQPRQRPGADAVRGRGDGRAGRLRRQRGRADRAPGDRLPQHPEPRRPRRSSVAPAAGTELSN